jgi:hypothetical protein
VPPEIDGEGRGRNQPVGISSRVCGQLSECDHDPGQGDCGFVAQLSLVVSGIYGTELFNLEVIFDEMWLDHGGLAVSDPLLME